MSQDINFCLLLYRYLVKTAFSKLDYMSATGTFLVCTVVGGFDMDVMNDLYKNMALTLPNEYDFVSGELRKTDHAAYLGNDLVKWNATAEFRKAYYVHFSDWPVPKPWLVSDDQLASTGPKCPSECEERELWIGLYTQFQKEMQQCD